MSDGHASSDAHAYVDNCLSPVERASFEAALRRDAKLRARVDAWEAQNEAIRLAFGVAPRARLAPSLARPSNENTAAVKPEFARAEPGPVDARAGPRRRPGEADVPPARGGARRFGLPGCVCWIRRRPARSARSFPGARRGRVAVGRGVSWPAARFHLRRSAGDLGMARAAFRAAESEAPRAAGMVPARRARRSRHRLGRRLRAVRGRLGRPRRVCCCATDGSGRNLPPIDSRDADETIVAGATSGFAYAAVGPTRSGVGALAPAAPPD